MLRRRQYGAVGALAVYGLVLFAIWYVWMGGSVDTETQGDGALNDAATQADMLLLPPEIVETNDQGVQELTLVITTDGYMPKRFALKKGVPAKIIFRQLGEVGCGNSLVLPTGPNETKTVALENARDRAVIEFTPWEAGDFPFHCTDNRSQGIMTVYE